MASLASLALARSPPASPAATAGTAAAAAAMLLLLLPWAALPGQRLPRLPMRSQLQEAGLCVCGAGHGMDGFGVAS